MSMICPECSTPMSAADECPSCGDRTVANRRAADATHQHRTPNWPPKAPPKASPATAEPSINGYTILGKLGEGGMGAVFLARDEMLGRQVAIKVITGGEDEVASARFLREARSMATAEHPNIVRVLSFGMIEGNQPYIVMELVDGESLSARIARSGRFNVDEALWIVRQVVDALAASWKKGIIHRDIKPSNILLDKQGNVRVADFGLAKPVKSEDDELTATGLVVGSPFYIAPEQATAQETDFRADIYSLGVVLFEMLAGERPFAGKNAFSIVAKHLNTPLPQLRTIRPELSGTVVALVEKMTAKDPASRYGSYALLLRDIDRVLAGDASLTSMNTAAKPAARGEQAASSLMMWAVGAVMVLLLVAIGVKIGSSRAAAARQRAEAEAAAKLAAQKPPESHVNVNALRPDAETTTQPAAVAPAQVVLQPIYIQQQAPAQAPAYQQPVTVIEQQMAPQQQPVYQPQPQQPVQQQPVQQQPMPRMPPPPPPGAPFPPPGGGPGPGGPPPPH